MFKRRYIRKERKSLSATQAGVQLIDTIHEPLLKSAKLTGLWESKLRQIERGQYSAAQFIDELKQMVGEIVLNVLRDNSGGSIVVEQEHRSKPKAPAGAAAEKPRKPRAPRIRSIGEIVCPQCGKGHIVKGRTAYGCSEYRSGCPLRLPFDTYPADLTPAQLRRAIARNYQAGSKG